MRDRSALEYKQNFLSVVWAGFIVLIAVAMASAAQALQNGQSSRSVTGTPSGAAVNSTKNASALRDSLPYIEIKSSVYLDDDDISIGDLLVTNKIDDHIADKIRGVKIGATPKLGEEIVFSDKAISEILRQEVFRVSGATGLFVFKRIPLRIPSEIHVRRAYPMFNETNFRNEMKSIFQPECDGCQFEFSRIRIPPRRPGADGLLWTILRPTLKVKGPFTVRVDFKEADELRFSEWVNGEMRIFKTVAVSERALNIGDRIQPGDVRLARRDVTFSGDSSPTEAELIGAKMKRSLRADDIIGRGDVERERAVKKGEWVEIVSGTEGLRVSLKGMAEDSGMIGDQIRVQNPASKKQLSGVVIAKGIVEIK